MKIPVDKIQVREGRRELDAGHVRELADSIRELGLLNPVTVDRENVLIAGLHRLEAVKLLQWPAVECTVSSLEGLRAELAEIDENFVRNDLATVEYGDLLLRRKEIYEALHPETKRGMRNGQTSKTEATSVLETKSFAQDTAKKLGVAPRTIERKVQAAKNLTPEAKEIVKKKEIGFENALKISRLKPEQQKEAAVLLAAKEIKTVDEYTSKQIQPGEKKPELDKPAPVPLSKEPCPSFKEMVADLKNTEKEYACTPEIFLTEYSNFVAKIVKEMEWYASPLYEAAFPYLSEAQFTIIRQQTDSICFAASNLFSKIERKKKL